ncbi:uncharacterized protein DSM5745_08939 [Aspergillus mulundensis]|uniref:Ell binding protein Ebp1 C-terminal domain-containing protein n=1 Tax=Aspergillus mulundensis TaxID=1810919 RepID=A0A3D8R570_9EURO|nr:Uncharacterized protein DSM5745_08939 [Aspergillus mulundensis]RDW69179.1 Uncharacterized protein DSM5745_08939 [Aspergillus mulundensis]
MSSRSTDNSVRPSASIRGRSTQAEQGLVDRRLKRLREKVLPFYPFLLTLPTDVPFRLGNRFVNNWAVGNDGPFAPEEQQLQYMTFLTHDESDSLLVAVGDWSDATGSVMADPRSRPQSATSTPSSNSARRKISLHDYRHKRKNGTSPSPVNQEAASHQGASTLQVPNDIHTPKYIPNSDNHHRPPKTRPSSKSASQFDPEYVDRKRPSDREHDRQGLLAQDSAPAKRRKLSPDPPTPQPKAELSNGSGLPELLSPTLPPVSSTPRLPRLLSPTLPPDLERELAKLGSEPLASDSQPESAGNSDTAKLQAQKEKSSARGASQSGSTNATSTSNIYSKSPRSWPEMSVIKDVETAKSSSHTVENAHSQSQGDNRTSRPSSTKYIQASSSGPRFVVRLKYGKSNRKRVEALLKFSGKRKLSRQSSPMPDAVEREVTHSTKPGQAKATTPSHTSKFAYLDGRSKHAAGSQANSSIKDRSKEPRLAGAEKPQTLALSQTQQEKARPASLTPAKELKHPSRHEAVSNDVKGHSYPAPRKAPADLSTSNATTQSPSQPGSADRNGERRAWKEEYQKYGNLGRELKHAADRHTAKDKVASTDEKLAAATAIEAIICFVLAFIAEDQSKVISRQIGDSSTWLSIIAYWRVVKKKSLSYPPLHSLCLILGAVSYDAIHALDLERLAVTPIPGEHTPVPTPASDGQPVHPEDNKKTFKDFLELKTRLPDCYRESQRLWFDGSRGLSEDILAREFPETWSKRARNYCEQGKKRLQPGNYSGEIYLPLGKTSTPLEIVRFSCALLSEWCARENINWRGKLDI